MSEPARTTRFEALDVLRGLAVLGMAFSGMVPYRTLPAWMYHAQLPPPSRDFSPNVFGLTWVDLVFPMFLFAMGAAIPLALQRRVERGEPNVAIFKSLLGRGLLLAVYALVGQHLRPYVLADAPQFGDWVISLVGFLLVGLILVRWPEQVPKKWRRAGTLFAWIAAAFIIALWHYPDDTVGFANYRNDVILMVLANVAVSGGAIWLWTRERPAVRWAIFAAVAAMFMTKDLPGLGKTIWDWDPTDYLAFKNGPYGRFLPILYHFEYHKYLLIVLPGTFVGDLVQRALTGLRAYPEPVSSASPNTAYMRLQTRSRRMLRAYAPPFFVRYVNGIEASPRLPRSDGATVGATGESPSTPEGLRPWSNLQRAAQRYKRVIASWIGPAAIVIACAGLSARDVVPTTILLVALLFVATKIELRTDDPTEQLAHRLFQFAAPLLIVGLLCEPLGGGIRKDPATLSYFLVTSGLCSMLLGSLAFAARALATSGVWRTIRDTGTNPIVGYLVITNLVWGIVGITGIEEGINNATQNPLILTGWGFLKTIFVALMTAWFTRRKLFLRA